MNKYVRGNYIGLVTPSAKKVALGGMGVNVDIKPSQSNVLQLCEEILGLERSGEYEKAVEILSFVWQESSPDIRTDGLTNIETANLLLRVGSVSSALGAARQTKDAQSSARDFLCRAERIFIGEGDLDGAAQCENKIAVTYWRNGDFSAARAFLEMALENAVSDETKAGALVNFGILENCDSNHEESFRHLSNAYQYIGCVSLFTEAAVRHEIAVAYEILFEKSAPAETEKYFDLALIEYEQALFCYETLGHKRFEVSTRHNIGQLFYAMRRYPEAVRELEIAKTRAYQLRDNVHIGIICDTLSTVQLTLGNKEIAVTHAANAVKYFSANENSYRLALALINYAVALSRSGSKEKARETFAEAEETSHYIGDRKVAARARLFALREFFSEYNTHERRRLFEDAAELLSGFQEKTITDTLEEIEKAVEAGQETLTDPAPKSTASTDQTESVETVQPIALDEHLRRVERDFIEKAIASAGGNQTAAARLLGLSRQTFMKRLEKRYPDLVTRVNQFSKKNDLRLFPSHKITVSGAAEDQRLGLTVLEDDLGEELLAGDALIVRYGFWSINRLIVFIGAGGKLKIGRLRYTDAGYALEISGKRLLEFNKDGVEKIVGKSVDTVRLIYTKVICCGAVKDKKLIYRAAN